MEKSLIQKAFNTTDLDKDYLLELSQMVTNLENYELNELDGFNKEFTEINKFINDIFNSQIDDSIKIKKIASLISIELDYFNKAIDSSNEKFILIFFNLIYLSHFPFVLFLDYYKIDQNQLLKATELIYNILNRVEFTVNSPNSKSFNDAIPLNFRIADVHIVNDIFYSTESKMTDLRMSFWYYLFDFMVCYNYLLFQNLVLNSNTIQKVFYLIKNLNQNEIRILAENNNLTNKWMIYGVMKKYLGIKEFDNEDINNILILINRVYYFHGLNGLNQFIKEFNNKELFVTSFAYFLPKISEEELKKVLDNNLEFNIYDFKHDIKKIFLNIYEDNVNIIKLKKFLDFVYRKWSLFLKEDVFDEKYLINLILTDYADFIVHYYCICCSNDFISEHILKNFIKIKNINYKWFKSESNLRNYFFIHLTQIYLLSYAYAYKNLNNNEIKELLLEFNNDKIMYQRFSLNNLEEYLNQINKNLF